MLDPSQYSPVLPGELIVDKYLVERVLGVGAMGIVVAARHVALGRPVAIKILVERGGFGSRDDAFARFLTEARAAARIDSDHVCRVFDVGTLPTGEPFMVMEHLEGNDLETELERRGHLGFDEAVDFVLQAADAICAAHALGIVHRDLKPANLFLSVRPDGSRRLKVLDFGISTMHDAKRPVEDGSIGTPAYMSPEQIRTPSHVDARTDIWALGAILYELVTGQTAFVGPGLEQILDMVQHDDPCPMNALRRGVPGELEAIVMRCLERDRERRWPTAAHFAKQLAPFGSIGIVAQLVSVQAELGSTTSLRVRSHPSVEPMIASIRDTAPDQHELLVRESIVADWREFRARKRKAESAVLVLASLTALAATIAVILHVASRSAPVPAFASAPPPAAEPLPPAAYVQPAPTSVASTRISPALTPVPRPPKPDLGRPVPTRD